ncbi:hypothetical protein ACSSS7_007167 [Eimeria intestinalis]
MRIHQRDERGVLHAEGPPKAPQRGPSEMPDGSYGLDQGRGASSAAEAACRAGTPPCCCRGSSAPTDEWGGPYSQGERSARDAQHFPPSDAQQARGPPLMLAGSAADGHHPNLGAPTVLLPALIAAAERAAARGCECCPTYWQRVAAAAAAVDFNLSWGPSGPLQGSAQGLVGGVCLSHVALPLLRPLLRLVVRLSAAIEAAAENSRALWWALDTNQPTAIAAAAAAAAGLKDQKPTGNVGDAAQALPEESVEALVGLLLLCRTTLGALIETLRCALRGLSRHAAGPQGSPLLGAPLSVRELSCVAGSFRGPQKALSLLHRLRAAGACRSLQSQGVQGRPLGAAGSSSHQRWTRGPPFTDAAFTWGKNIQVSPSGARLCESAASVALWGQELRVMFQEAIGGTLLLSLGASQRARLPEGALMGSLWGPLSSASWKGGLGGAPTGKAGAHGLLLKNSLTLSGLLQLIAAFEAPLAGLVSGSFAAWGPTEQGAPPLSAPPFPSLGPPHALLELLERQIWEAQGYWGPPVDAVRRPRKRTFLSAAALQQQQQKQQQQQDAAESAEVEKLVFAATALAEARAAEGPPKGQRGPFFLGLSLVGDALLQRLEALLSSVPAAFQSISPRASSLQPPGRPPVFVPDPLVAAAPPLLRARLLKGLLPSWALGAPSAPHPAAVAVLPLLLVQSLARAEVSHEALLAGICFGLVRPLEREALDGGLPPQRGAFRWASKTHQPPHAFKGTPAFVDHGGAPKEAGQKPGALCEHPRISCVLDLWPSAAICQLTGAFNSLGFSSPAFFRFLFAHYHPPREPFKGVFPTRSSVLRRSRALRACCWRPASRRSCPAASKAAAATAAAAAAAARRALGTIAAASGARDPADLEEEGPQGGAPLEAWEASLGWLLRAPKRQRRFVCLLLQRECKGGPWSCRGAPPRYERDFSSCSKGQLLQMLLAAAASGAPPPRPEWLKHFCTVLLKAPQEVPSCSADLPASTAAAAAAARAAAAKEVGTAALLLPYLPPLSATSMVGLPEKLCTIGGPPAQHAAGGLETSHEASSVKGPFPLAENLGDEHVGLVDPCALPSLLLGLLLHAPPPKPFIEQNQPCAPPESSHCNSSSCSNCCSSSSSWRVLRAFCLVLEGTARALLSVWERDLPPESLGGHSLAAIFGLRSSTGYSSNSSQGKGLTGAAVARLCRQSFTACLALAHLVIPLPITPQLSPAVSCLLAQQRQQQHRQEQLQQQQRQQQQQLEVRGRRGRLLQRLGGAPAMCVAPGWALRLLPLRHLRHLLLLLLLSSSPSLWNGASIGSTKAQEPDGPLALLHCPGFLATNVGAVHTEAGEIAGHRFQHLLDCLLQQQQQQHQQQQQQQQQHFIRGEPTSSQFQREVAAALLGLSDSLEALSTTGPQPDKRGFLRTPWRVEKEVAVGPYFLDLLVVGVGPSRVG